LARKNERVFTSTDWDWKKLARAAAKVLFPDAGGALMMQHSSFIKILFTSSMAAARGMYNLDFRLIA
jgi:hypothetical protein